MRSGLTPEVLLLKRPTSWALGFFVLATLACHPGNREAKLLREGCESGDFAACNALGQRLLKGEYVLRDDKQTHDERNTVQEPWTRLETERRIATDGERY